MKGALDAVLAQVRADGDEDIDVESLINPPPARAAAAPPVPGVHPSWQTPAALLEVLLRLSGREDGAALLAELVQEGQRRGYRVRLNVVPPGALSAPVPPPLLPPPAPEAGPWLTPAEADLQHAQVWWVKTNSGVYTWAQIDGYEMVRGRPAWRAIALGNRRVVKVRYVLMGTCPRVGGRRERARR